MVKRIVIIDRKLCRNIKCGYLCAQACPINRSGKECIITDSETKFPIVDEALCIGCGICVKKCDKAGFKAISIVNLPEKLKEDPMHRYGKNMFELFRLPTPKKDNVVLLIGPNGVGKTTVLNILSNQLKPNIGLFKNITWEEIIDKFRGSELQEYLEKLAKKEIKVAYKPQHVDSIPKLWKGKVKQFIKKENLEKLEKEYDFLFRKISGMLDKDIKNLSGGELQILAITATVSKDADLYFFDEPSSYLDVFDRLSAAREIRKLINKARVVIVEHDLSVADYLGDIVYILYGEPGAFGIVSKPYHVRVGINSYLEGYVKEDNVRFRTEPIIFDKSAKKPEKFERFFSFPSFEKTFKNNDGADSFLLKTESGEIYKNEVIGILGPNSIGKTTFIKMLAGKIKPDKGNLMERKHIIDAKLDKNKINDIGKISSHDVCFKLAYKPQRLVISKSESEKTVQEFLIDKIGKMDKEAKRIIKFLNLERLFERKMSSLSGGELQLVFIAATFSQDSDLLLLDEPSAFLDVEQRLKVAKLVKNEIERKETACFIVDHDILFIDLISDRLMIFDGKPGLIGHAYAPSELREGMNKFLKSMNVTFRRDPITGRPRANKPESRLDKEQKEKGKYFYS